MENPNTLGEQSLKRSYAAELLDYLTNPRGAGLISAQRLGQAAFEEQMSLLDLTEIHHEALKAILKRVLALPEMAVLATDPKPEHRALMQLLYSLSPDENSASVSAAGTFIKEILLPFDGNLREGRQRNAVLYRQKQALEDIAQRVGRLICDETLQLLMVVRLELYRLQKDIPLSSLWYLKKIYEHIDQIDTQLYALSNELGPRLLHDLGLPAAVEYLALQFSREGEIPIRVASSISGFVPGPIAIAIYKAVQEALTNVLRHSRAKSASIHLEDRAGALTCFIQDDGIGFDASGILDAAGDRGFGLIGIRVDTALVGGTFTIDSQVGSGTKLCVSIHRAPPSGSVPMIADGFDTANA